MVVSNVLAGVLASSVRVHCSRALCLPLQAARNTTTYACPLPASSTTQDATVRLPLCRDKFAEAGPANEAALWQGFLASNE